MSLISSAATGVAAGAMLDAGTNNSMYALPVFSCEDVDSEHFLLPLYMLTVKMLMGQYDECSWGNMMIAI